MAVTVASRQQLAVTEILVELTLKNMHEVIMFFFQKDPWQQVDIQHVRNATMNGAEVILPEHLSDSNYCIVLDCEVPALEAWQTLSESFHVDGDGYYQRVLHVGSRPVEEFRNQRLAEINVDRDKMLESELLVLKTPDDIEWQFNSSSIKVLEQTLIMSSLSPAFLPPFWRDKNNINHECTADLLIAIGGCYYSYKAEIYTASWAMKAAIDAAESAAAIATVKWQDYLSPASATAALVCIGQIYTPTED